MITGAIFVNIIVIVTVVAVFALIMTLIYKKLRENETMKYEFITIIAHKFRTPLTQIKWSIEGFIKEERDPYKKQAFTDIMTANENLINLTGTLVDLTDASHSNSDYTFERIELCALTRKIMAESKNLFHTKNLFISINCSEPEIFISVDRSRFEFVLATVLENACNYSIAGRNIAITVSGDRHHAAVSVTDDGIGIDPKDMPRVFSKFFRTKQAQAMDTEGLGVALYLARSIMKRLKGKIEGFSEGLDRGSTFSVILPRVK